MKIGQRVVRGADWEWSDQDGGAGSEGTCIDGGKGGWTKVKWDNGGSGSYKNGFDDAYDLAPAPVSNSSTDANHISVSNFPNRNIKIFPEWICPYIIYCCSTH
jgi:hypothetical protein